MIQVDLGTMIGVAGCLVGVAGWMRNRDTDKSGSIRQMTTVEVKLDTVIAGLAKIETASLKTECTVQNLETKFSAMEESLKIAHKRLEALEKKGE